MVQEGGTEDRDSPEFFDDEESDDSESEDEGFTGSKKRRLKPKGGKKKRGGLSFVDTEAQVGSEESEADDYDFIEDDLLDEAEEAEGRQAELARRRQLFKDTAATARTGGASHLATAIGDLEKRYIVDEQQQAAETSRRRLSEDYSGEEEEEEDYYGGDGSVPLGGLGGADDVVARLLPDASAPSLWKVSTLRSIHPKEAVIEVLQRYSDMVSRDRANFFLISAAYASDKLKNAIYVEAANPNVIMENLKGLKSLFLTREHIKLVPLREMADVFTADMQTKAADEISMPKEGDWVRLKKGLYGGDIALVTEVDDVGKKLSVRVVPRIDLDSLEHHGTSTEATDLTSPMQQPKPSGKRPSPKLLQRSDLEQRNIEVEPSAFPDMFYIGANCLIDEATGYLVLNARLSQFIVGKGVKATSEEIRQFVGDMQIETLIPELAGKISYEGAREVAFIAGDRVNVVTGDLAGVKGKVHMVESTPGALEILVDATGSIVRVPISHCIKQFSEGESVKIVSGPHSGDTGLIVAIREEITKGKGPVASVLSTSSMRQIDDIPLDYLVPADLMTGGIPTTSVPIGSRIAPGGFGAIEGLSVGDMVQESSGEMNVGVIIRVNAQAKTLDLLMATCGDSNQLKKGVPVTQVRKKTLRLTQALDCRDRQFPIGANVEVVTGEHASKIGRVAHIWKQMVFLHFPQLLADSGYVCVEASQVKVSNGNVPSTHDQKDPGRSQRPGEPIMPQKRGGMSLRNRFLLSGKQVRLVGGRYKGYTGELRSVGNTDAVVLLVSKGLEVTVPKDVIMILDDLPSYLAMSFGGGHQRGSGYRGPRPPSQPRNMPNWQH